MGILSDFKAFIFRGNVVDLAVGIIIGAAFGKIVNSFVTDILTPPLGLLQGGVPFKDYKIPLTTKAPGEEGEVASILLGNFVQTVIDFLIVATAVFVMILVMRKAQAMFERKQEAAKAADPPEEIVLLREIRDSLKSPRV